MGSVRGSGLHHRGRPQDGSRAAHGMHQEPAGGPPDGPAPDRQHAEGARVQEHGALREGSHAARARPVARLQGPLVAVGRAERVLMPDERRIEIRGGAVTFKVLAAGRGAPLLYFHSYHERSAWSPFLDLLARSFSVYAPAHPGVAGSAGIETLEDLLDLTLVYDELLGALGIEHAHLVGHSFGAMVAAEIAAVFPARGKSLTLVSPLGLWPDHAPSADILILPADELAAALWRDPASRVAPTWGRGTASGRPNTPRP